MTLALLILLIALQVGDAATTIIAIRGGGREANKVMAWLFKRLGMIPALILFKGALIGGFIAGYMLGDEGLDLILGVLCALYVCVVGWNLLQLKRSGLL